MKRTINDLWVAACEMQEHIEKMEGFFGLSFSLDGCGAIHGEALFHLHLMHNFETVTVKDIKDFPAHIGDCFEALYEIEAIAQEIAQEKPLVEVEFDPIKKVMNAVFNARLSLSKVTEE